MMDPIQTQNHFNATEPRPQRQPDEGAVELCFALPPAVAEAFQRYVGEARCSSDNGATRAIALLLMQTGYATPAVNAEYLARTFPGEVAA